MQILGANTCKQDANDEVVKNNPGNQSKSNSSGKSNKSQDLPKKVNLVIFFLHDTILNTI